jgi:hypothetical protein
MYVQVTHRESPIEVGFQKTFRKGPSLGQDSRFRSLSEEVQDGRCGKCESGST